jgi:outer membrane protein OmpA-like peptidoglycan-associated protein
MNSSVHSLVMPLAALLVLSTAPCAAAAEYALEDPVPPGARGEVLAISGPVLQIRGIASGLTGKSESLQAALKDLGAQVTDQEIRIALAADVLFDFDKASLRREAKPALDKVVAVLKSYPKASATIEGHTDAKGNEAYNQKLSERRAQSVRTWLAAHGAALRMSTRGLGETKPVAPNAKPDGKDDPEGRQKNRRVEIVVRTR